MSALQAEQRQSAAGAVWFMASRMTAQTRRQKTDSSVFPSGGTAAVKIEMNSFVLLVRFAHPVVEFDERRDR